MNPGLIEMMQFGGGEQAPQGEYVPPPPNPCPTRSRVCGDLSKIQTGACLLRYDGNSLGHTLEGMKFSAQPDLRVRSVDEYGTGKADLIYQGESIDVSVNLLQWMAAVLRVVYQWQTAGPSYVAIGPAPGRRGRTIGKELLVRPLGVPDGAED